MAYKDDSIPAGGRCLCPVSPGMSAPAAAFFAGKGLFQPAPQQVPGLLAGGGLAHAEVPADPEDIPQFQRHWYLFDLVLCGNPGI